MYPLSLIILDGSLTLWIIEEPLKVWKNLPTGDMKAEFERHQNREFAG